MMQHRIMIPFRISVFLIAFLSLSICFLLPAVVVHALPEQATGWVEVQCSPVPEDFSDTATVILSNTETGEYYTITCHKANGYVGRLQLPVGKYQIEQATTADNFAYEALTAARAFDITPDMPAAQLITLQIIKHDASFEPPVEEEIPGTSEDIDVPGEEVPSQIQKPTDEPTDDKQEQSNPVLDWLFQESQSEDSDSAHDTEQTEDTDESSPFLRIVKVIVGTIIFIIVIFTVAFFARRHYQNES